ncbi:hypothetical protein [Sediminimonas sp.]|uniref:hypothetical protein n=1 Tax=Sediminimonas sp. TaxID=2823379 RepID=UPI0025CF91DC|nr:hypothetical protein [Sediminimonas sp.]
MRLCLVFLSMLAMSVAFGDAAMADVRETATSPLQVAKYLPLPDTGAQDRDCHPRLDCESAAIDTRAQGHAGARRFGAGVTVPEHGVLKGTYVLFDPPPPRVRAAHKTNTRKRILEI